MEEVRESGKGEGDKVGEDSDEAPSIPEDCLISNHVGSRRRRGKGESAHSCRERETLPTITANGSEPVDFKSVPTANCLTNSLKERPVRGVAAKRCIFPKGGSLSQTTTSTVEGGRQCLNGEGLRRAESAPGPPLGRHTSSSNNRDGTVGDRSVRGVPNDQASVQASLDSSATCTLGTEERMDTLSVTMTMEQDSNLNSTLNGINESSSASSPAVDIDCRRLLSLFDSVVSATEGCGLEKMEKLLATFDHLVFRYRLRNDRKQLVNVSTMYIGVYTVTNDFQEIFVHYGSTHMYLCPTYMYVNYCMHIHVHT